MLLESNGTPNVRTCPSLSICKCRISFVFFLEQATHLSLEQATHLFLEQSAHLFLEQSTHPILNYNQRISAISISTVSIVYANMTKG